MNPDIAIRADILVRYARALLQHGRRAIDEAVHHGNAATFNPLLKGSAADVPPEGRITDLHKRYVRHGNTKPKTPRLLARLMTLHMHFCRISAPSYRFLGLGLSCTNLALMRWPAQCSRPISPRVRKTPPVLLCGVAMGS